MVAAGELTVDELERVIERAVRRALDDFLEDLEALGSDAYLRSIEKARRDVRAGKTAPLLDFRDE